MEMSRSCHFTIPGCHSLEPLDVFRVLRVAILKPTAAAVVNDPSAASADDAYSATWPFTYETFVPELLRQRESANSLRERMERMRETFSKVVAFLRISGKYPSRLREKLRLNCPFIQSGLIKLVPSCFILNILTTSASKFMKIGALLRYYVPIMR